MISAGDFRNGLIFIFEGALYQVIEFQHHKPGKGRAFMRSKIKNLKTGAITEHTFRPEEKFDEASLEYQKMQYLYQEGEKYCFMDQETYEQINLDKELLGENVKFLKENLEIKLIKWNHEIVGIELPIFIDLEVTYTEPGLKGDTVSSTTKPATLETGAIVQVPLFVEIGDIIRIDTRTGEYSSRA